MATEKIEQWPTSVEQRIQFILAISQLGTTTEKMKRSFSEYFNELVEEHIVDPAFRNRLKNIPTTIRSDLDPDGKQVISMQAYRSAVVKCILDDLIDNQNEKFFTEKHQKETEENFNALLEAIRAEEDTKLRLQAYIKNLIEQNNQIELMALAISLSMRYRIQALQEEQTKLLGKISSEIYKDLRNDNEFNSLLEQLKDSEGNPIILSEALWQEIISLSIKQYTEECADFCLYNNRIPPDEVVNNQAPVAAGLPGLNRHKAQENNLFTNFNSQRPNRFSSLLQEALGSKNINIEHESPEMSAIGEKIRNKAEKSKDLMELVNINVAIKSISSNANVISNNIQMDYAENVNRMNIF